MKFQTKKQRKYFVIQKIDVSLQRFRQEGN